jgi:photosystem II stability/assembly factor-like uncharacterized protein
VAEQDALSPIESHPTSRRRVVAVLVPAAALVAGLGFIGTRLLHGTTSQPPAASLPVGAATLPPTSNATPIAPPTPTAAPVGVIDNLKMFTATIGWAQRQSDGAILHTTEGVEHWIVRMPALGAMRIVGVSYVDADSAQVLTAVVPSSVSTVATTAVHAWATDDGGTTWTEAGSFLAVGVSAGLPGALDFVDRDDGWFSIIGGASGSSFMTVYRTQDGGARWSRVVATTNLTPQNAPGTIHFGCDKFPALFISTTAGWVSAACPGGTPLLYVTHDGGVIWTSASLGLGRSDDGYLTNPPQFVASNVGFMLVFSYNTAGAPVVTLCVTSDGGATWSAERTPESVDDASEFIDPEDGWLIMDSSGTSHNESTLWATYNAGRTWTDLGLNNGLGGLQLDFLTTQDGWAFPGGLSQPPSDPQDLQTLDGGRTWTAIYPTIAEP